MNPAIFVSMAMVVVAIGIGTLTSVINSPWVIFFLSPLFFVLLALKDFRIGVVLLVIIVTVGQSRLLPSFSGFNVFNYLILGAALGLAISWFGNRKSIVKPPLALCLLLVPLTIGLLNGLFRLDSLPVGTELIEGSKAVGMTEYVKLLYLRPLLYVVLTCLIANAIMQSKRPEKWAIPIAISAVVPAAVVIGIIVGFGLDLQSLSRNWALLGSIGIHKNSLGGVLALSLAPILFLIPVVKSKLWRLVLIASLLIIATALLMTFSRGGVTAGVVIWIAFCILQRRYGWLVLSIALAPALFVILPTEMIDRLMLGLDQSEGTFSKAQSDDELSAGRLWIWGQLLPEVAKRPLIGTGISGHLWSELALISKVSYPHNLLLSSLIDLGVLGTLAVLTFFFVLIKGFFRLSQSEVLHPHLRALSLAGCAMTIGWLFFGLTNSDYIPGKEQIPIWIAAGILFAYWPLAFPQVAQRNFTGKYVSQVN